MTIHVQNLRSLRSVDAAVELLRLLRYEERALSYDASDLGLDRPAVRIHSGRASRGYGVLVGEVESVPRSLRTFGRRLVEQFHDYPLAILGVPNGGGEWSQAVVVRPRLISGGAGAVSVAKLTIDVERPTAHDAEVVGALHWDPTEDERAAQQRIDRALDVERVTRRFFGGLAERHERLLAAVRSAGEGDEEVRAGLDRAGGAERLSLRIVTQVLFCYFLQRKGLLEGDRAWLSNEYRRNLSRGDYYSRILEPLFYDALAQPLDRRPPEWRRDGIPFLNGGLFERHYGDVSLPIPDDVVSATDDGLLEFLDRWTFTVAEEAADESEVAVDPEMLGKVFESLISEEELRREGTVYTPRPVVQFMCREAIVPYLERETGLPEDDARRLLLDDEWLAAQAEAKTLARRVDAAAERIRVIDPAVGSGAFLLGMMSELVRLRRLAFATEHDGREPEPYDVWRWKLDAVEHSLFGVDVNATAIELCRLRLWLSLLVEEQPGRVQPLPNLEYRTVSGDSLRDFVAGVEVQQTRGGALTLGFDLPDPDRLVALRDRYFETSDPEEKERLRTELRNVEDEVVDRIFERALENARLQAAARGKEVRERGAAALETQIPDLESRFRSRDRVFPAFLPAFHAPDVSREGGWHVVVMNPPYVGRKEVAQRFDASYRADLTAHYGRTFDLMIHFGFRAFELARPGGVVSMIFNDSIFTSTDGTNFRRKLFADRDAVASVSALARTRCFEGIAVNGGVVVAVEQPDDRALRYVENHGRPPEELAGASVPTTDRLLPVSDSELWLADVDNYKRLPHRPLFRPSAEALTILDCYGESAAWDELRALPAWERVSETPAFERWKEGLRRHGFFDQLQSKRFVLLGLVVTGGQGLATADDRRFLAAVEGTAEADDAIARRTSLESLTLAHPEASELYRRRRAAGREVDEALLDTSLVFSERDLRWPRIGLIRTAPVNAVYRGELSEDVIASGISGEQTFVPFEKGDASTSTGAAAWTRATPSSLSGLSRLSACSGIGRGRAVPRRPTLGTRGCGGRAGSRSTASQATYVLALFPGARSLVT